MLFELTKLGQIIRVNKVWAALSGVKCRSYIFQANPCAILVHETGQQLPKLVKFCLFLLQSMTKPGRIKVYS